MHAFDDAAKRAFVARCRQGGDDDYEHLIRAIYTELSGDWPRSAVVDGGAHKGLHTFWLAALAPVSEVVAIEANAGLIAGLENWKAKAGSHGDKVRVVEAAVQDDPDRYTVEFHISPTHPGRSGIDPILRGANHTRFDEPVSVPATTIDQLLEGTELPCSFIKLDLEGSEFAALRGGSATLKAYRPLVLFENGSDTPEKMGYEREAFLGFLADHDMTALTAFGERMTPANQPAFWYAWACDADRADEVAGVIAQAAARREAAAG